ncbi:MAG TPA: methyltransferase domain-containing protein [Patescibacteria group bacterium]|nr:methyltransferase domain-containing protein [Patescibacteria group bacterium]
MDIHLDAYDIAYSDIGQELLKKVGEEVYGEYIGQLSWMTTEEYRRFIARLAPTPESHVLEIGSGNGAAAVYLAVTTKARATGLDNNEAGIHRAVALSKARGVEDRVDFRLGDATGRLPFDDGTFDAVFANDTFSLIPDRAALLRECHRVLRPGGRLLYTDPMVLVGIVTSDEIAMRSWAGLSCLIPRGENERLLDAAGFELLSYEDLTESVIVVARRQAVAFEKFREDVTSNLGEEIYEGLVNSTGMAETLAKQRRLIRIAFLSRKPNSR